MQNILMASLSPLWVKITDFGISKRWADTALKTQCGTALYQAPELIGLLPKRLKTVGHIYNSSVDIWALGAVVHQVLTSQIPFLEIGLSLDDSDYDSTATGSSIDGELLLDYCAEREPFPVESLITHGASADAVDFIKNLMVPDPKERLSAANALQSVWLRDMASIAVSEQNTPGLPQSTIAELLAESGLEVGESAGQVSSPHPLRRDIIVPLSTALIPIQSLDRPPSSPALVGSGTPSSPHRAMATEPRNNNPLPSSLSPGNRSWSAPDFIL